MNLTEDQQSLKTFLEAGSWQMRQAQTRGAADFRYASMYELTLAAGRPMEGRKPPSPSMRGQVKQCFRNACLAAMLYPERYIYCEGYAASIIPVHHSWVCDHDGVAYEVTWDEPGASYWGIPFAEEYCHRYWGARGMKEDFVVTLIDRWKDGWPLVSGTDRVEEAVHPLFKKEAYDVWKGDGFGS
jgi:hypothetical protein